VRQVSDRLTQMTKAQQLALAQRGEIRRKRAPAPDAKRRKGRTCATPPARPDGLARLHDNYRELGVFGVRRFLLLQARAKAYCAGLVARQRSLAMLRRAHAMRVIGTYLRVAIAARRVAKESAPDGAGGGGGGGGRRGNLTGRLLGRKGGGVDKDGRPLLPGGLQRGSIKSFRALRTLLASDEAVVVSAMRGSSSSSTMTMQRSYKKMGGRTLRIFLSSTFRDMNIERDVFVRRYVPALRQRCTELGLHLSIVDLRWGVTVEQAQTGEVVPICMSEVEACQYFACFLGARYGWRPTKQDLPEFAFSRFPFLASYVPGRSVTECEILYGALGWGSDSHVPTKRAFFYTREDAYLETLPEKEANEYQERDAFGKKNLRDVSAAHGRTRLLANALLLASARMRCVGIGRLPPSIP
jgi:hypothetical protein